MTTAAYDEPAALMLIPKNVDNSIRWKPGERLEQLYEARCDELVRAGDASHLAVSAAGVHLTFTELDQRANRLARYLLANGLKSGDRIGMLFDKGYDAYVAMLAILKVNAAYVPLDLGFPADRIAFILADAQVQTVLTLASHRAKLAGLDLTVIAIDEAARQAAQLPSSRLSDAEKGAPVDELAYLIYTSGTTGKPKGVAIDHASICNFVRVAAEVYGYAQNDRVFQGMTLAFDFSVEELWVPLLAGATLIPAPPGGSLVGADLARFLKDNRITALCCVPTLLATLETDLPDLRLLLVSGEACPQNLVDRWHRPERIMLNAYGPTEATVTATLKTLAPGEPVTIGVPLPTYTVVIIDPDDEREIADGQSGEIGIAGVGLARGYLGRDELTRQKFVPDFLDIPNNPSKRIYRTGDLGRITDAGEIEYLGRIDTQVKIRGYRIELTEIESVLMQDEAIAQAVVHTHEAEPGAVELVAYYSRKAGAPPIDEAKLRRRLMTELPGYMVPAYLEELPVIPMTTSNKADRKALPAPKAARGSFSSENYVAPRSEFEARIAETLARILKIERVSANANFFFDLGAHSLLMARFAAELRKLPGIGDVAMTDIYANPTVQDLASALQSSSRIEPPAAFLPTIQPASRASYYLCGTLQAAAYLLGSFLSIALFVEGAQYIHADVNDLWGTYTRTVVFAVAAAAILTAVPIAAKWLLIGRWRAEEFPIWSLRFFNFWLVRTLVRSAPPIAVPGTPVYNWYLRMLGAKIGPGAILNFKAMPVATDLLSVGAGTVIDRDVIASGYRAVFPAIQIAPIEIGANAFVGASTVIDIGTRIGSNSELGHASGLAPGQKIPDGESYGGSPAIATSTKFRPLPQSEISWWRPAAYTFFQLATIFLVLIPLPLLALVYGLPYMPDFSVALSDANSTQSLASTALEILGWSLVLYATLLLAALATIYALPRVLSAFLQEGKTYPLYGLHWGLHQTIVRFSNSKYFNVIFGDSSYIVGYLKLVGYKLLRVVQTGSNFGCTQKHDHPFFCEVGSGTMISDGISFRNLELSSTHFRLRKSRLAAHNYLGNGLSIPPDSRVGENCLIGTKTMMPIDGPLLENTGLLGSPSFLIPRTTQRDDAIVKKYDGASLQTQLRFKNRHNLITIALLLFSRWVLFSVTLLFAVSVDEFHAGQGLIGTYLAAAGTFAFTIVFAAFMERASLGFGRLKPEVASIYDPYFWFHERHWKLAETPMMAMFKGTPFKAWMNRLLGIRAGRQLFDDGCMFIEKTLADIGDNVVLNDNSLLQGHSLEEGVFKSDYIKIADKVTLAPGALIHYGTVIGSGALIDTDCFLMKGEAPEAATRWLGNPARRTTPKSAAPNAAPIIDVRLPAAVP